MILPTTDFPGSISPPLSLPLSLSHLIFLSFVDLIWNFPRPWGQEKVLHSLIPAILLSSCCERSICCRQNVKKQKESDSASDAWDTGYRTEERHTSDLFLLGIISLSLGSQDVPAPLSAVWAAWAAFFFFSEKHRITEWLILEGTLIGRDYMEHKNICPYYVHLHPSFDTFMHFWYK